MSTVQNSYGRVDENSNVYLLESGVERLIGSQPSMSPDEALAFYVKRYEDLASSVRLVEQRLKAKADARSISKSAVKLLSDLESPSAVGDLASLRSRLQVVIDSLAEALAVADKEREEAVTKALAEREAIVSAAEQIVAGDPNKTNYKNASAKMTELFETWQALQKSGIKVPKSKGDAIWKRFSSARKTFESNKRTYFSKQDALVKASKGAKLDLVSKAEALVAKGAEGFSAYRDLLTAWKALPKVKSKQDDEFWARFKAAGDAIYAAKNEKAAADDVEFSANLKAKLALLEEAEKIDPAANLDAAKSSLKSIQARWEKAGKVPRDSIRNIEDRLRAVERKIKDIEQELWRKSDPATIDRTNSMKTQLEDAIAKLENEIKTATDSGDQAKAKKAQEELETKKAWLEVVKNS